MDLYKQKFIKIQEDVTNWSKVHAASIVSKQIQRQSTQSDSEFEQQTPSKENV